MYSRHPDHHINIINSENGTLRYRLWQQMTATRRFARTRSDSYQVPNSLAIARFPIKRLPAHNRLICLVALQPVLPLRIVVRQVRQVFKVRRRRPAVPMQTTPITLRPLCRTSQEYLGCCALKPKLSIIPSDFLQSDVQGVLYGMLLGGLRARDQSPVFTPFPFVLHDVNGKQDKTQWVMLVD